MLFLLQTTLVGGPPVVTQVNVNVGDSVIGSSGSNWNSMFCCRTISPGWVEDTHYRIATKHTHTN